MMIKKIFLNNYSKSIKGYLLLFILFLLISCKNDSSGSKDSFFSFGSDEVEILGTADIIQQELTTEENLKLLRKDSALAFYKRRNFEPAWQDHDTRENLLKTFDEAEVEGLYAKDYHGEEIRKKLENIQDLDDTEKSRLDIILTDAFLEFGEHLLNGKTNPKNFHEIYDVPRDSLSTLSILEEVVQEKKLEESIEKLRPHHPLYFGLIESSREYKKLKENFKGFEIIPEGEMVKAGEKDQRLPLIQERLKFFGHLNEVDSTNVTNSENIQEALKSFQKENGIEADGIIGNSTIKMLNKGYDKRYEDVLVNLERWRWYPRELGDHYIIVNIANFQLHVVKDNDTVKSHKTMVGTEARKTPIFSEEIDHIVFNPTWTIPPTIKTRDVIPGMRKNSNYLSRKNIEVYDASGSPVSASSINWNGDEAQSYTFRQEPGVTNPLGRVKIMYPNQYLIYLHDTPSKALFERDSRSESSGCVRVEDAIGLAEYLLSDQGQYSSKKIEEIIAKGATKQIEMKQKVKVYHLYWTAWRENGKTRFTEDIYNYDNKILEALKAS
ncbi:L,D-transpeptidase family protein [Antarcticibacterium sp. 1MA-6-2]|uniref:L,D-transpeptidase family protein n=1 Tax=Antarcticibacterium sp. 1MA-6-2 TaxID=2908210 RepID=UPI001F00E258|nr:L,D-transpeptidase family protein [Antarcticibacterium sp. 1MA-6-2]UJH91085.1 L,D-transpeptidase family protein [Antarcticibacterium sp. 1MA-6-2]